MARPDGTNGFFEATSQAHDLNDSSADAAKGMEARLERAHLVPILAFLNREIDQSAVLLNDLAKRLSHEFCELSEAESRDAIQQRMLASTIALQSEDRIQQRLGDLRTALALIERALNQGNPISGEDFERKMIDQLNLEEIRIAFAHSVGMTSGIPTLSTAVEAPSLGEIDLF